MLDKFKKLLGTQEANAATETEDKNTITVKVDAEDFKAELEQLKAEFATQLEGAKAEAADALAQAVAQAEQLIAAKDETIAKLVAEKEQMIADDLATKMAARKEKIVASIGTEKADALMKATEGLDDTAFEAVVSAMAGSVEAEASTALFREVGVDAVADATKVVAEESTTMKILKAQYQVN